MFAADPELITDIWTLAGVEGGELYRDVPDDDSPAEAYMRAWFKEGTRTPVKVMFAALPTVHPEGLPRKEWQEGFEENHGAPASWEGILEFLVAHDLFVEVKTLVLAREIGTRPGHHPFM